MAKRIAKFEKVSFEQFKEGYLDAIGQDSDEVIRSIYDALKLPKRATKGSAGYDFYAPRAITLKPGEDSNRNSCEDGRKLGTSVLSEKRTWIQIPPAVE
mgnify:CR=1 FL=1